MQEEKVKVGGGRGRRRRRRGGRRRRRRTVVIDERPFLWIVIWSLIDLPLESHGHQMGEEVYAQATSHLIVSALKGGDLSH